jgi:DNA-binding NarL/FixJ family response regulator
MIDNGSMAFDDMPPLPMTDGQWDRLATTLKLSPQQKRIVELILRNRCDKQIASAMQIKKSTIRTYITRVFQRLGVADRHELILLLFAMSHGICPYQSRHHW